MNSINFWYKTQQQIFFFLCLVLCDILATFVVNQHIQCLPANDRGWEDCITLLIQAPTAPEDATTDTGKVPSSTGAMLKKRSRLQVVVCFDIIGFQRRFEGRTLQMQCFM